MGEQRCSACRRLCERVGHSEKGEFEVRNSEVHINSSTMTGSGAHNRCRFQGSIQVGRTIRRSALYVFTARSAQKNSFKDGALISRTVMMPW